MPDALKTSKGNVKQRDAGCLEDFKGERKGMLLLSHGIKIPTPIKLYITLQYMEHKFWSWPLGWPHVYRVDILSQASPGYELN